LIYINAASDLICELRDINHAKRFSDPRRPMGSWQMGRNNEVRNARRGDVSRIEDAAAARARFPRDPLIDGPEPIKPLYDRKASL
jgi:hypothetical protein